MYNKGYGGKMRSLLILSVILCLVITSVSCLPTKSAGPSAKDVSQDEAIAENKRAIQSVSDTKVNGDTFNLLKSRVDTMEVKVNSSGVGNSYDRSQLYTKAEVDSAIAAAITALKAATDQSWIKVGGGSSSGGGTLDPVDGAILDTDGDLQLILERSVEEEVWIDDNINQTFRLTVRNNGTSSTYFRINCDFDCEESVAITSATLTPDYSGSGVATPAAIGASTVTSIPFLITSTGSSNKIYIGKSREESMFVTLKVDYATAVGKRWTWDFSIRDVE